MMWFAVMVVSFFGTLGVLIFAKSIKQGVYEYLMREYETDKKEAARREREWMSMTPDDREWFDKFYEMENDDRDGRNR